MNKLFSFFITTLFLLAFVIIFISCTKEYSYEGGMSNGTSSGTAVYTLDGAGGACTGSVVIGKYYAGTSLGPTNTIQLKVNVTIIGTYNLGTNSINGIYFSNSGNFTNTGMQTITLTGSGTPISDGSFNFNTPVGSGCFFTAVVNKAPVAIAGFTLAGAPNDCENALVNGNYVSGLRLTNSNTVDINVNVTAIGNYTFNTDTIDGISFSKSGTFTTTGNQKVILVGSGTPLFPRNLIFTPLAANAGCTFKVVVLNPPPLATYVLESGFGNPNPCNYSIAGSYISNKPLSDSNTVRIRVFVTVVGNFTVATNITNGMMFSFTGAFTTTGSQDVLLKGSGTPVTQGIYTFMPEIVGPHPLGGQTCAVVVTVN